MIIHQVLLIKAHYVFHVIINIYDSHNVEFELKIKLTPVSFSLFFSYENKSNPYLVERILLLYIMQNKIFC